MSSELGSAQILDWRRAFSGSLERKTRFELATPSLARRCSTAELLPLSFDGPATEEARPAISALFAFGAEEGI